MKPLKDIPGASLDKATGKWTIKLAFPVSAGGQTINEIVMRRAKVNDSLNVQRIPGQLPADMEVQLFAALSGLPATAIGELDQVDYAVLQEVYSDFLASRRMMFGVPASTSLTSQDGAGAKSD